jgi:hypothetical protein
VIESAEATGSQGARSAAYSSYAGEEQRREPGCIGAQVGGSGWESKPRQHSYVIRSIHSITESREV